MSRQAMFKVISVSNNTNSFGLYGVIICDRNGLSFEIAVSQLNLPKQGNYITGTVTDNDNLQSLPFSYEIPRKLPKPGKDTLTEMFEDIAEKKGLVNIAKGKQVTTSLEFAKTFAKLDVKKKNAVLKNLNDCLAKGISPTGLKVTESERPAIEQLARWCVTNILHGNKLCPPENINLY